jgi:hypothetical protein
MESIELTDIICQLHSSGNIDEISIQTFNEEGLGDVSIKFIRDQFVKVSFSTDTI